MFFRHLSQFKEAESFLDENQFEEAAQAFSKILEKAPETLEALLYRAMSYLYANRLEEAWADANRAVELRPNYAVGFMVRGEVELEKKDFSSAYESFRAAVKLEADNGRALFGLAKASAALGRKFEAAEAMEEALQFERDYVMAQAFVQLFTASAKDRFQ